MENYDVFAVSEAVFPIRQLSRPPFVQYVQNGGSAFFIADHYSSGRNKNRWDASEVLNGCRSGAYSDPTGGMTEEEARPDAMSDVVSGDWLATYFGARFRYNARGDIGGNVITGPDECFGITNNVSSAAMHAGSAIAITDPSIAKSIVYLPSGLTSNNKRSSAVDGGFYNGGSIEYRTYILALPRKSWPARNRL